MADISKIKLPDNVTYNIKDANAIPKNTSGNTQMLRRPASLQGANDVTLDSKINTLRANRLAFLPADQIIIEKTTDGGTTWVDAGVSDATKTGLFSETRAGVSLPLLNGVKSLLCGIRITFTAMKYNVPSGTAETAKYNYWNSNYIASTERYNQLKEMYFWVSTNSDTMGIKVQRATGAVPTNWVTIFDDSSFLMTGWSGCDYLRFSQDVFGGGTTQTSNYWNYRITLMTKGTTASGGSTLATTYTTSAQSVMEIRGYGDTWWTAGNEYAANDKIYTHDYLKNVTFPNKVTATGGFAGNVTGNVSGTASNVTGTVAIANGGTGTTTAAGAANNLITSLPDWTADPTDTTKLIRRDTSGTASFGQITFSTVWNYIKGKISSILGLTATNYGGTSAKATADASGNTITSYYAPKSTAVTNVALATNKITKTINGSTTDVVTAATTSAYGITKLSTSTSSTATDLAATPSAVKTAYDLANGANTTANTALSGVNGTLIYDHTYTISNGVATFTPHVYQKGVEVTTNYAKSCFVWKYKLASNMSSTPSYVTLTTNNDRTCTVNISTLGYGGYVLGEFTPA